MADTTGNQGSIPLFTSPSWYLQTPGVSKQLGTWKYPRNTTASLTVRFCRAAFSPVYILWFKVHKNTPSSLLPPLHSSTPPVRTRAEAEVYILTRSPWRPVVYSGLVWPRCLRGNLCGRKALQDKCCVLFHIITRLYVLSLMNYVWWVLVCLH